MALPKTSVLNYIMKMINSCLPPACRTGRAGRQKGPVRRSPGEGGFTLTEVLIVLGLFAIIASFTAFAGLDSYRSYIFRSERYNLISLLQKARSQALANIDQTSHGVHFDNSGYSLFEGSSFVSGLASNIFFPASGSVSHSQAADIVFDQLTAATSGGGITLHDGIHPDAIISINNEGRIDY